MPLMSAASALLAPNMNGRGKQMTPTIDAAIRECELLQSLCYNQQVRITDAFQRMLDVLHSCRDNERPFPFSAEVYYAVSAYQESLLPRTTNC
jgi:hypothetical protein